MPADLDLSRPADHLALLTLDRPASRNALSIALRDAISDALAELAEDPAVRCVVVTGTGPVFSAGFDLGEFDLAATDPEVGGRLWASSDRYHRSVLRFPLPTIAAVNGPAVAGGFDLAVLCDVRMASTMARFSHPERTFGPVVYGPLREVVGGAMARDLCLTGRELDAPEAHHVGLVSAVVAPERLLDESLAIAARTALAPRDLLMATKAKALRFAGYAGTDATTTLDL